MNISKYLFIFLVCFSFYSCGTRTEEFTPSIQKAEELPLLLDQAGGLTAADMDRQFRETAAALNLVREALAEEGLDVPQLPFQTNSRPDFGTDTADESWVKAYALLSEPLLREE